jgi:hypothetical protein
MNASRHVLLVGEVKFYDRQNIRRAQSNAMAIIEYLKTL